MSADVLDAWRTDLAELARHRNVRVKLGGMLMPLVGLGFDALPERGEPGVIAEAIAPLVNYVIQCFGVERCMFESNWPMDSVSTSYTALWSAYKLLTGHRPQDQLDWLFHRTALEAYAIDPHTVPRLVRQAL
jgi:predicted TIM-barrel fold metal-dependent hydrolase